MFGKSVPLIAIVLSGILMLSASAALLDYYGLIGSQVPIIQSVLVDGKDVSGIISKVYVDNVIAGSTICELNHDLYNRAPINAKVKFATFYDPDDVPVGITTTYLNPVAYLYEESIDIEGSDYNLELTVEEDGDWMVWTFDFPVEQFTGDGNLNVGLIIALEGDGYGPAFQIHNTDSDGMTFTDGTPVPAGTWVYSGWGPAIDTLGTWYGWHQTNIAVSDPTLDWIVASGNRKGQGTDGVLQIKIDRTMLGEFHWAASPTVGSGFWDAYDVTMQVPPDFGWSVPIVGQDGEEPPQALENYKSATIGTEIIGDITLSPGETFEFYICYNFHVAMVPVEYTITTQVQPVP